MSIEEVISQSSQESVPSIMSSTGLSSDLADTSLNSQSQKFEEMETAVNQHLQHVSDLEQRLNE